MTTGIIVRDSTVSIRDTAQARAIAAQVCPSAPLRGTDPHPVIDALDDLCLTGTPRPCGLIEVGSSDDPEVPQGCYEKLQELMRALAAFTDSNSPGEPAQIEWRAADDEHRFWRWLFQDGALHCQSGQITYPAR